MKLLLDSNLSHRVAEMLRDGGLDAVHVRDYGLQHDSDAAIMQFARERSLVMSPRTPISVSFWRNSEPLHHRWCCFAPTNR